MPDAGLLDPRETTRTESGRSAVSSHVTGTVPEGDSSGEFGANEWLVDEMYELFLQDKNLVDSSWWPVLENYHRTAATPGAVGGEAQIPEVIGEEPPVEAPTTSPGTTTPVARTTSVEAKPQPIPADAPATAPITTAAADAEPQPEPENTVVALKGPAKSLASNMDASLTVPTATSVRTIPAKLMIDNRIVINNHLKRARGGKVSFTHLIAWAMVQTLKEFPSQNVFYDEVDGKPSVVTPAHINLGIAIDIPKPDGSRALVVPGVKRADTMGFGEFLTAYEDVVARGRTNKLTAADFQGNTISLTNPGGIGTVHSVPRLMRGPGLPSSASAPSTTRPSGRARATKTLNKNAVEQDRSRSPRTYDHRIIQGAQSSGDFLQDHPPAPPRRATASIDEIFAVAAHPLRAGPLDPADISTRSRTTTTSTRSPACRSSSTRTACVAT